jgi:hypothetical protein
MPKRESFTFKATIGRTWILYTVHVPQRVTRALGTKGKVPVIFTLDGSLPRKTTLAPRADGGHRLHVHGESRREVGAKEGDTVTIVLSRDVDRTGIAMPPELAEALREAGALETFRTMGPAMQRELVAYVEKAKRDETRRKYVARVVERASEEREKRLDREARATAQSVVTESSRTINQSRRGPPAGARRQRRGGSRGSSGR